MRKHSLALAALLVFVGQTAFALSGLVTPEQTDSALKNSLSYKSTLLDYERAAEDLGVDIWDKTRIKASSNIAQYQADGDRREDSWVSSIDVTQPLTNELSLGAKLTSENQTTLSLEFQPFANEWVSPQQRYAFEQAKIKYAFAEQKIILDVQRTWLDALLAKMNLAQMQTEYDLALNTQKSLAQAALVDNVSTNALTEAQRKTLSAQQDLLSAKIEFSEVELALYESFGEQSPALEVPDINYLSQLIADNQIQLESYNSRNASSESIQLMQAKTDFLADSADHIMLFDSDLTFTSSYELENEVLKAGVSLNLSPSAWNKSQQLDAKLEQSLQEAELNQQETALAQQVRLTQQRLQIETESAALAELSLLQQQQVVDETQLLFNLGERTELELAEQQAKLKAAEINHYKVLFNLLKAQLNYGQYFQ